jgi:DNA-directed RNA polymerase subunit M/transcription elongation factor TFIIS
MRKCKKCGGMMFPERVIDMLDGLIGHFFACANCGRRDEAARCIQPMHDSESVKPELATKT